MEDKGCYDVTAPRAAPLFARLQQSRPAATLDRDTAIDRVLSGETVIAQMKASTACQDSPDQRASVQSRRRAVLQHGTGQTFDRSQLLVIRHRVEEWHANQATT